MPEISYTFDLIWPKCRNISYTFELILPKCRNISYTFPKVPECFQNSAVFLTHLTECRNISYTFDTQPYKNSQQLRIIQKEGQKCLHILKTEFKQSQKGATLSSNMKRGGQKCRKHASYTCRKHASGTFKVSTIFGKK